MTDAGFKGRIAAPTLLSVALLASFAVQPAARAQTLVSSFSFDDSGNTTTATGADPVTLSLYGVVVGSTNTGTSTDLHGAAGSGVSGLLTDKSLNLGSAFQTGSQNGGIASGPVNSTTNVPTAATFSNYNPRTAAFTIVGWYNAATGSAYSSGTRILDGSVLLAFTSGDKLQLQVGSGSAPNIANSVAVTPTLNQWEFFAVTYDGSTTASFYFGSTTSATSLTTVDTGVTPTGALTSASETVGNTTGMNRSFDGSLDDLSLYKGALNGTQLEAIRQANLTDSAVVLPSAAPEPSSIVLAGGMMFGSMGLSRLRRRRLRKNVL